MIRIDPLLVAVIVGPLVPILVGLAVKAGADDRTKSVVAAVLGAAVAVIANATIPETGVAVVSWRMVAQAVLTMVVSSTSYAGFWKPAIQVNDRLLPTKGIG